MSDRDVVRAWKSRRYRNQLRSVGHTDLPESPAGAVDVPDERLAAAQGGEMAWTLDYMCATNVVSVCICSSANCVPDDWA